jgi:putative redox protein
VELRFDSDGVRLAGHLARPSGARQPRPGLVLCHGFPAVAGGGAYAAGTFTHLADRLASSLGWIALASAFRGCAPPEGDFSLGGWLNDVGAAVASLRAQEDVEAVWLAGFGRGGALAICAAARDPEVRGVIAFAPPADFDDWASQPRRLLEFARRAEVVHDPNFPRSFDQWNAELRSVRTVECAEAMAPRPLMVIHGAQDSSVPVFDARVLVDAHGSADLRIVSGASHDLRLDPRAVAILVGWLDRQWTRYKTAPGTRP